MICDSLARLIAPSSIEAFLTRTWARESRLFRGALRDPEDILSLESFEQILATLNRAHEGWLHFARGGVQRVPQDAVDADGMLDLRKIRAAFAAGDTLYLTKAERLSMPLTRLCRAIELDLNAQGVGLRRAPNAHVFLTPPDAQGFEAHADEHGSFVLQLEGEKKWVVHEPVADPPLAAPRRPGAVNRDALSSLTAHAYDLVRGDVLYMPAWWPHEAKTSGTHSLHATVRVFPLRWCDLVHDVEAAHPALHQSVPRAALASPAATTEALVGLLQSAAFCDPLPGLLDDARRRRVFARPALADGGLRQALEADRLGMDTELERPADRACVVFGGGDEVCIGFPGGLIRGPSMIRDVFDYVSAARVFRPCDFPPIEAGEYDRVEVARAMVRDGLLRVVATRS